MCSSEFTRQVPKDLGTTVQSDCPFCKCLANDCELSSNPNFDGTWESLVVCSRCGANGPLVCGDSQEEAEIRAALAWDRVSNVKVAIWSEERRVYQLADGRWSFDGDEWFDWDVPDHVILAGGPHHGKLCG